MKRIALLILVILIIGQGPIVGAHTEENPDCGVFSVEGYNHHGTTMLKITNQNGEAVPNARIYSNKSYIGETDSEGEFFTSSAISNNIIVVTDEHAEKISLGWGIYLKKKCE